MNIERIIYGEPNSFILYGAFDRRCRNFVSTFAPEGAQVPTDAILREMSTRWICQPELCGYFVALDANAVVGHIAAWIVNYYGAPRLFVWQVEIDQTFETTLVQGVQSLRGWIDGLNRQLPPPSKVSTVELVTWHKPGVFIRYLEKVGLKPIFSHSVLLFRL